MKYHYPIKISYFLYAFIPWLLWTTGWAFFIPGEDLIWAPFKWIITCAFLPLGVILLASLVGYTVTVKKSKLIFGFFPLIKRIPLKTIQDITNGAVVPISIWQTNEFITIKRENKKEISFPCNDADKLIAEIREAIIKKES